MLFTTARFALASLLLAVFSVAEAGPLLDAIKARRAEHESPRQESEFQENESGSPSRGITLPAGTKLLRDIAYGNDSRQRMDVYLPAQTAGAPVIFMVHGGAWRTGDKAMSRVVQNKLQRWVSRGFVFVSVNYRLLPKADPLTQANDVAQAMVAAQAKAASWGADPARFILMGHSAGAHLIDLLAADPDKALKLGAQRWLGAVSLDTAAMDIVRTMQAKHYAFYDKAFGQDPAYWQAASPMHQLKSGAAPFLLVCSSTRPDAPCTQASAFADKASAQGVRAEVLPQALQHSQINELLGTPGAYTGAVEAFMASLDPEVMQRLANSGTIKY